MTRIEEAIPRLLAQLDKGPPISPRYFVLTHSDIIQQLDLIKIIN